MKTSFAVDLDCSFQNSLDFRPGCRANGAGASIFGVGRSLRRLCCHMPARVAGRRAAAAAECQKLRLLRPAATPVVGRFVRIVLSDYNDLS
jgi:hypothetical protein